MPQLDRTSIRDRRRAGEAARAAALQAQHDRFMLEAPRLGCLARRFTDPDAARAPATGLLAGVGLAHKDVFDWPGHAPGYGRPAAADPLAVGAAPVLQKLRDAGAAHLGALALAEDCCGATGDSRFFGRPTNPVDARAVVGGSSSGSAVAVAAGLCPASLGTDTAGSIRIPAATCGVLGLKLTAGAADAYGMRTLAPSLDALGVVAACASDAAHVLAALCQQVSVDPDDVSDGIERALAQPRRWRIANATDTFLLSDSVAASLRRFIERLDALGTVVGVTVPRLPRWTALASVLLHVEGAETLGQALRADAQRLTSAAKSIALPGLAIPAPWYVRALRGRPSEEQAFVHDVLGDADLLLTPALAREVPDWDEVSPGHPRYHGKHLQALHENFPFANYLGLPALVFPIGQDSRGRPVSVQAVARRHDENLLLAFAHQAAQLAG